MDEVIDSISKWFRDLTSPTEGIQNEDVLQEKEEKVCG